MDLLEHLLRTAPAPVGEGNIVDHWRATAYDRLRFPAPIDAAVVGGFSADRLGLAFVSGYAAALRTLVPELPPDACACLCATEAGGNHPRAILTRLNPSSDGFVLDGEKRWATLAPLADLALVVASVGPDASGRNRLRVVTVALDAPGVQVEALPPTPFAPEVPHAVVRLQDVRVAPDDLLPGDGYDGYLKPFRTIEDLHVHAALLGWLVGVARRAVWPQDVIERLLGLILAVRALATRDPLAVATHLALAGLLADARQLVERIEPLWSAASPPEAERWHRDRALLGVAEKAREARRLAAWSGLGRRD